MWFICVSVFLLGVVSCAKSPPSKITFVSDRDGHFSIYLMNEDGSDVFSVSDALSIDFQPVFSPDGSKIAYYSDANILVVDLNGNIMSRIGDDRNISDHPSWSQDSQYIAFHSTIDGNFEIYKMHIDDSTPIRLTENPLHDDSCPVFSPDGQKIAFASGELGQFELYVMRSDGSEIQRLGPGTTSVCPFYAWSPDSEKIAAVTFSTLYVVNIANPDDLQIIGECVHPYVSWSPDGAQLAFASDFCTNNTKNTAVFTIDLASAHEKQLTGNFSASFYPVWSPNGQQILFVSERDGNREIYVMKADGSEQVNLTNHDAEDFMPVWQP